MLAMCWIYHTLSSSVSITHFLETDGALLQPPDLYTRICEKKTVRMSVQKSYVKCTTRDVFFDAQIQTQTKNLLTVHRQGSALWSLLNYCV